MSSLDSRILICRYPKHTSSDKALRKQMKSATRDTELGETYQELQTRVSADKRIA